MSMHTLKYIGRLFGILGSGIVMGMNLPAAIQEPVYEPELYKMGIALALGCIFIISVLSD